MDTKSEEINFNGILKAAKEKKIYIYTEENKHLLLNEW